MEDVAEPSPKDHLEARNRLGAEASPYLRARKDDPVHWWPWGDEALAQARQEDKPIFLVVGFTACRWCQVMARESFSDPRIADLMNERFINVLVDRHERPEIDEIYMAAAQLLNHQGGWPSTFFLTPNLRPFFAGTYFPPEDRQDRPGFETVLHSLHHAWTERREEVGMQADELEPVLRRFLHEEVGPAPEVPSPKVALHALDSLRVRFDEQWGGFGGPSKFPSPANLRLLLELSAEASITESGETGPSAAQMLDLTLDQMARSGIYDHLAGGFHRCSIDPAWRRPQFEKMLPENAQLLEIYSDWYRRLQAPSQGLPIARLLRQTAEFLRRDLTLPEGGLACSLDGEHHGHEGAPYIWTLGEISHVLGAEDAGFLAPLLGFAEPLGEGQEFYVLHRPRALDEEARRRRMTVEDLLDVLASLESKLFEDRQKRPRPMRDEQVLSGWNGLGIAGLASAGGALEDADILDQARSVAEFVVEQLRPQGSPLQRHWYLGVASHDALLEDYVFLVHGLLRLHRVTDEDRWLENARELAAEQEERLAAPGGGFFTAAPRGDLLCRSRPIFDGALPATNAMAILNLLELARLDPRGAWDASAETAIRAFGAAAEVQSDSARALCLAVWHYHHSKHPEKPAP